MEDKQEPLLSRVDALPEPDRRALRLRFKEGLRNQEVAELAGIPAAQVSQRLHAALMSLCGGPPDLGSGLARDFRADMLCAYVLDEASPEERRLVERAIVESSLVRAELDALRALMARLRQAFLCEDSPPPQPPPQPRQPRRRWWRLGVAMAGLAALIPYVLQERSPPATSRSTPRNLVFLLDTSGSMHSPDKLPLVKTALQRLVPLFAAQDRIALTVYAGAAGTVLPTTEGSAHGTILAALERLEAGGPTAAGAGLQLAFSLAEASRRPGDLTQIILVTDGDFTFDGVSRTAALTEVTERARAGISLMILKLGSDDATPALAELAQAKGADIIQIKSADDVVRTLSGPSAPQ